jgi:protein-S-isoprenylcysteine O-methyltransferase Ste14
MIAAGTALYVWCVWNFAAVGGGTPGPGTHRRGVVAAGPYRWVRNPIYLAALLIVLGEAWLFMSLALLAYATAMAVLFHLFVTGYEEPTLRRRFGTTYLEYQRTVPRWIPRRPRQGWNSVHPLAIPGSGAGRRTSSRTLVRAAQGEEVGWARRWKR